MRRPHVYERSAPRGARGAYQEPPAAAAPAIKDLAAALPELIDKAQAAGLGSTADLLRQALADLQVVRDG